MAQIALSLHLAWLKFSGDLAYANNFDKTI